MLNAELVEAKEAESRNSEAYIDNSTGIQRDLLDISNWFSFNIPCESNKILYCCQLRLDTWNISGIR